MIIHMQRERSCTLKILPQTEIENKREVKEKRNNFFIKNNNVCVEKDECFIIRTTRDGHILFWKGGVLK